MKLNQYHDEVIRNCGGAINCHFNEEGGYEFKQTVKSMSCT